jgi:hypothetical protein
VAWRQGIFLGWGRRRAACPFCGNVDDKLSDGWGQTDATKRRPHFRSVLHAGCGVTCTIAMLLMLQSVSPLCRPRHRNGQCHVSACRQPVTA